MEHTIIAVMSDNAVWSIDCALQELATQHDIIHIAEVIALQVGTSDTASTQAELATHYPFRSVTASEAGFMPMLTYLFADAKAQANAIQLCLGHVTPLISSQCLLAAQPAFDTADKLWFINDAEAGFSMYELPFVRLQTILSAHNRNGLNSVNHASTELLDERRHAFFKSLPERHQQVVRRVLQCLDNRTIAAELHVASGVIAGRLTEIYELLQSFGDYPLSKRVSRVELIQFFGDFFHRNSNL